MSEFIERKAISEWIKYELDTKLLDPPEIEVRLSPIESITNVDSFDSSGKMKLVSEIIVQKAMICVADWNLKSKGKVLPIEDLKIKERALRKLLGEKLKKKEPGENQVTRLGQAIIEYSSNQDNFLKN